MLRLQGKSVRGMTLIEICVVVGFLAIFAAISLSSLTTGKEKAPTRGTAYGLVEEFRSARQLAIANGHPVAIGIPTGGGSRASTSIYRLTGWNVPKVDWARDYSGDYPGVSFAAADFSSTLGSFSPGVDTSAISKFGAFDLNSWLPDQYENDSVFCFMPDGGLVSNGMPAINNQYTIVVGENANFTGSGGSFTVTQATEPLTLMIGAFGGMEVETGLPGGDVPNGGAGGSVSSPQSYWEPAKGSDGRDEIILSDVIVRPGLSGGEGVCKPGQTVNLEVFAYSPQGVELFARWNQDVDSTNSIPDKGFFSYPSDDLPVADADGNTVKEMDRMEYLPEFDSADHPDVSWTGAPAPTGGVFRARWSWTVPLGSQEGDYYDVGVDVQNAKGTARIVNPPAAPKLKAPKGGSVILEQNINGIWQLVRMNPDGTGRKPISPPGVEEYLPTVDRNGENMAYLQKDSVSGNISVMTRPLEGGEPTQIAGPGNFTSVSISPNGNFVAYRDNSGAGTLHVWDKGTNNTMDIPQSFTAGNGYTIKKSRAGWSWDSQHVLYETNEQIRSINLSGGIHSSAPPASHTVIEGITNTDEDGDTIVEDPYCPVVYKEPLNGDEYMIFSIGNFNPVLTIIPYTPSTTIGTQDLDDFTMVGAGTFSSSDLDDDYPSVSADGRFLILTRSPEGTGAEDDTPAELELIVLPATGNGDGNFTGPGESMGTGNRRGFFIP